MDKIEAIIESPWNTYNDSIQLLSQVLQGSFVKIYDKDYIILQIHNGCDVRGGYTHAKMFLLTDPNGYGLPALPMTDVYGTIDGKEVDNRYNGNSLTYENGKPVKIKPASKTHLYLAI